MRNEAHCSQWSHPQGAADDALGVAAQVVGVCAPTCAAAVRSPARRGVSRIGARLSAPRCLARCAGIPPPPRRGTTGNGPHLRPLRRPAACQEGSGEEAHFPREGGGRSKGGPPAGVPSPPPLCAECPVLIARAVSWRAARDKMTRDERSHCIL